MKIEDILKTEYSEEFDEKRKKAMAMSFYTYGRAKVNYKNGNVDAIKELEKRLSMFKADGNTERLIDIANFAMLRFMFPQNKEVYRATDSDKSPGLISGIGEKEI